MTDLTAGMSREQMLEERLRLNSISPDDGKYARESAKLAPYISAAAEWSMCARIQLVLLETRAEFGQARQEHVAAVRAAVQQFDPLNAALLEGRLRHDQLAVLEELGRWMPQEIKALLHPGTTSYDILDTARSVLFQGAWKEVIRPKVAEVIGKLCSSAEEYTRVLQAGRTHLQRTSPVPFSATLALYAARLAGRTEFCDGAFADLRGKISGIVGTGGSIDIVILEGKSLSF